LSIVLIYSKAKITKVAQTTAGISSVLWGSFPSSIWGGYTSIFMITKGLSYE